ncbi:hypothetical protein BLNAU_18886 [Blattamonas nauphoetae]|uniref:Transposase n=1 Tax=Blattamonas nauphoetae TaxID=2049346 RepID=A0ABQ9X792_9EUKA|nr:hypothetical protein BLNAU_18886 [Blattamonas nauphoetae]
MALSVKANAFPKVKKDSEFKNYVSCSLSHLLSLFFVNGKAELNDISDVDRKLMIGFSLAVPGTTIQINTVTNLAENAKTNESEDMNKTSKRNEAVQMVQIMEKHDLHATTGKDKQPSEDDQNQPVGEILTQELFLSNHKQPSNLPNPEPNHHLFLIILSYRGQYSVRMMSDRSHAPTSYKGRTGACDQSLAVRDLVRRFERTGKTDDLPRSGRSRTASTPAIRERVNQDVLARPTLSIRQRMRDLGLTFGTTHRIIHSLGFTPYRMQTSHWLFDQDYQERVRFCRWFLTKHQDSPTFLNQIWFTDESRFTLDSSVNIHNSYYYSRVNPHYHVEVPNTRRGLNVWCAISCLGMIGPIFYEGTMTGHKYRQMLR